MVGGYSAVIFITCAGKQQLVHHHTHSHRVKVIAHTRHSLPHVWSQKKCQNARNYICFLLINCFMVNFINI